MAMDWDHLLFMHWPVAPEILRPHVPPGLEIETFDGAAWLGIVPFEMRATRLRLTPPIPGLSRFPELNVRTYVRPASGPDGDKPGVWFFSLDATNRPAVEGARFAFHLPYFRAAMSIAHGDDGRVCYRHKRLDSNERRAFGPANAAPAMFEATYGPVGPPVYSRPGSLASFLTERYRLYAWSRAGYLSTCDIHHPRWLLQPTQASVKVCTMTGFLGFDLPPVPPVLHFTRHIEVAAWRPRRIQVRGSTPSR